MLRQQSSHVELKATSVDLSHAVLKAASIYEQTLNTRQSTAVTRTAAPAHLCGWCLRLAYLPVGLSRQRRHAVLKAAIFDMSQLSTRESPTAVTRTAAPAHICGWCLRVANMPVGLSCSAQSCNISSEPTLNTREFTAVTRTTVPAHICDWCLHMANMRVGLSRQTPACSAQRCNISQEPCNHRLPRSLQTLQTNQHGNLPISKSVASHI